MDKRMASLWVELCGILRAAPAGYVHKKDIPDYLRFLLDANTPNRNSFVNYCPGRGWHLKSNCSSKLQSLKRMLRQEAA